MKLREILNGLNYEVIQGDISIEINEIRNDNRLVTPGDLFICIEGFKMDGHNFVKSSVEKGAKAIICSRHIEPIESVTIIKIKDTREAMAICASNFYNKPSEKLKVIGITGTKGKTTSSYMLKSILENEGAKVGVIGTIANFIGSEKIEAHRTTPESLELQELFNKMVQEKVQYCIMEVSSHSLELKRTHGVTFTEGIFSNLSQDHMDFHITFENYFRAKAKLFDNAIHANVNIDDEYGARLMEMLNIPVNGFSVKENTNVFASDIKLHSRSCQFKVNHKNASFQIKLNIPGIYNVYNALGCISAALNMGISEESIVKGLSEVIVPGRFEVVAKKHDLDFEIIIDYAHTPDSLLNILKTGREFTKGRLITVFGCGGDRDRIKRPIMGKIASENSDIVIVTSDNPRSEEPHMIIEEIVTGIEKDNYIVVENRKDAIKEAIKIGRKDDVIIIAGKGHEDYQILKNETIAFDERIIIDEIMKEIF